MQREDSEESKQLALCPMPEDANSLIVQLRNPNGPNLLKLLVTNSAPFLRFRATCASSALLLALVDFLASQLSITWVRQKVGEVSDHVRTAKRLMLLVFRTLQRKRIERMCKFVRLVPAAEKGELVVAWLLILNRDHQSDALAAYAKEETLRFSNASKTSEDTNTLEIPIVRLNEPKRKNTWQQLAGGKSETMPNFVAVAQVRRGEFQIEVRLKPTRQAVDQYGAYLINRMDGTIIWPPFLSYLDWCGETESLPSGLNLEFTVQTLDSRRKEANEVLETLETDLTQLGELLRKRDRTLSGPPAIELKESRCGAMITTSRNLMPQLPSLVPIEMATLERDVADFLASIKTDGVRENYTALLLGPPGVGKTSNVLHLARNHGLSVTLHSLSSFCKCQAFQTPGKHLVLIEEFETQFANLVQSDAQTASNDLSRLYNLLEGSSNYQGGVVVLTANSIPAEYQRDFPAMFRVGRIDRIVHFSGQVPPAKLIVALEECQVPTEVVAQVREDSMEEIQDFTVSEVVGFARRLCREWRRQEPPKDPRTTVRQVLDERRIEQSLRRPQRPI